MVSRHAKHRAPHEDNRVIQQKQRPAAQLLSVAGLGRQTEQGMDRGQLTPAGLAQIQLMAGNQAAVRMITSAPTGLIQRGKDTYAYGSANTVPHIHVYSGGDCHLKILDRGRVRRYNIIQDGKRHSQADDALAAAAGNGTLLTAINDLLAGP
jgi:hypothetical protein